MIIQYADQQDRLAAQLVQQKVGGYASSSYVNPNGLNQDIVIIGGQIANPTYAAFVNVGVLPNIPADTAGTIYVGSYNGHTVYGVAGSSRGDTVAAAEWVYLYGLPSSTTNAGTVTGLKLLSIPLKNNADLLNAAQNSLDSIMSRGNTLVNPIGLHIDGVVLNGTVLEFAIRTTSGGFQVQTVFNFVALIIGAIIAVIGALVSLPWIIAIGGIIAGAAVLSDWFTSGSPERKSAAYQDLFETLVSQGVPPEQAAQIANLTANSTQGDIFNKLLLIGGAVLIIGGGLILYKEVS